MNAPVLEISRAVFRANIAAIRSRLGSSQLMLVMKDDAYGHGIEWAVPAGEEAGVRWFGGYDIPSALRIRALTSRRVYAWATSSIEEVEAALRADVELGVGSARYLRDVIAAAERLGTPVALHLKIDTGLHRNGFRPEHWDEAVQIARTAERRGSARIAGVWSHLAEASDAEDDAAQQVFLDAVRRLEATGDAPEVLHLTASAAAWWRPELRGSLSRIGAFCYGVRSADGPALEGVRPIARLVATVEEVRTDHVRLGIGSFHGLPSILRGAAVMTPAGPRGIIRIDGVSTAVETWPRASVGDRVVLFGPGDDGEPDATGLAERIDTVGEEILTRLTPAVARVLTD
ncbi:alanine racemase [Microbacterium sp. NPDC058342]|uniref:alanine racemase n=1 Tax=Microbacterium sp. NPDC058342 TaxID=3346454 RepID=UPI00365C7051